MNKSSVIHARIEPRTKTAAERVLSRLGLSPTEAIRIFYTQITLRQGLPFSVDIPNELTASTLRKSRKGQEVEAFASTDAMSASWQK